MIPKATKTYTHEPNRRGDEADIPQTPVFMQLSEPHLVYTSIYLQVVGVETYSLSAEHDSPKTFEDKQTI